MKLREEPLDGKLSSVSHHQDRVKSLVVWFEHIIGKSKDRKIATKPKVRTKCQLISPSFNA